MSTSMSIPDDDSLEQFETYESQDAMYERCPAEELEEYAGLAEHPDETVRRLSAAGEWDGPGRAREHFEAELGLHLNSSDPRRRKNARRLAYELIQRAPQWEPPADAIPVPTIFEQRQRGEGTEEREPDLGDARGCRPPKQTPEEKAHFRQIDEEVAAGKRRCDLLEDIVWVYDHIDDDEITGLDAPSRGAWSTLFFARSNKDRFYNSTWPAAEKELRKRNGMNTRGTVSESEQKIRDELRQMIRDAVKHKKTLKAAEAASES